jgi:hypothetical protein
VSISATNFNLPSIRELIEQVISKSKSEYVGEESLLGFWKTTEVVFEFEFSPRLSFTGILDSYGSQWEVTKSSIRGNWCPTNHSITALRVSLFQGLARGYVVALPHRGDASAHGLRECSRCHLYRYTVHQSCSYGYLDLIRSEGGCWSILEVSSTWIVVAVLVLDRQIVYA